MINSSTKYVGCKSKNHLEKIVAMYNKVKEEKMLNHLETFLFDFINNG